MKLQLLSYGSSLVITLAVVWYLGLSRLLALGIFVFVVFWALATLGIFWLVKYLLDKRTSASAEELKSAVSFSFNNGVALAITLPLVLIGSVAGGVGALPPPLGLGGLFDDTPRGRAESFLDKLLADDLGGAARMVRDDDGSPEPRRVEERLGADVRIEGLEDYTIDDFDVADDRARLRLSLTYTQGAASAELSLIEHDDAWYASELEIEGEALLAPPER